MSKQYGCTTCHSIFDESELVTVHNPKWVMKPIDEQCCVFCKNLCVELVENVDMNRTPEELHGAGEDCGEEKCQTCCPHNERDHGICLDCAHEEDPGEAIDRAMDAYEDR